MKKIFLLISFIIISVYTYSLNFSLAPTRFEVDLSRVATNEIYVINHTTSPLRIETYLEADKSFGEKYSLVDDIVVFPKKIAIKAGGTQVVRFRVRTKPETPDGELKCYINFREVPETIKNTEEDKNNSQNVAVITELGVPVYGYKGEQIVDGTLKNISVKYKAKELHVTGISESFGNTSLKFSCEIIPSSGDKVTYNMGMSAREGKKKISVGMSIPDKFVGQKVKMVIKDQTSKVYYKGEKQL